jgi:hypothetical protein
MKLFSLALLLLSILFLGCSSTEIKKRKEYSTYFNKEYLQALDFSNSENGLLSILINNSWFYIREDGKAISVMRGDDGEADRFKEGLARIKINGKVGFFNKTLDIILIPIYDFAFPFHNGVAEVCLGCQELKENGHSILDGGSWKRIDRRGLILEE